MSQHQFGPKSIKDWDLAFEESEEEQEKVTKETSTKSKMPPENEQEIAEAG